MPPASFSDYLGTKAEADQARTRVLTALAQQQPLQPLSPPPSRKRSQPAPKPTPRAAKKTAATKAPGRPPKAKIEGGANLSPAEILTPAQRAGLLGTLREISLRPLGLAALEAHVMEALQAVIRGARMPGIAGHADRMVLFKLAGLPLGTSQNAGRAGAPVTAQIKEVGAEIVAAINRARAFSGRDPVTVDVTPEPEAAPVNALAGHEHKTGDLVRMDSEPAAVPPPPPEPIAAPAELLPWLR